MSGHNVEVCEFFRKHGYCVLGNNCKLFHARSDKVAKEYVSAIEDANQVTKNGKKQKNGTTKNGKEPAKVISIGPSVSSVTEICFSFDTTGSMSSYLEKVRSSLAEIVRDLFRKVPKIRISIIAHGDYCDKEHYYVIKYIDFTRDERKLINFVNNAGPTGGGDTPECYELALHYANKKLSWTKNARSKALVVIGDAPPHEPDYDLNTSNLDWRKETDKLRMQGVAIYGVYCGRSKSYIDFYQKISSLTGGKLLELTSIKHICKLFVALCLRTSDDDALFEQYKRQILRTGAADDELTKAIQSLSGMAKAARVNKEKIDSAVKRLMYDLKEIQREKLTDISVVPEDGNVFKWHCNFKAQQGVFKNVYIHLTLEFPSHYPQNPPEICLVSKFPNDIHPNIVDNNICLPLFGADKTDSKFGSSWSAAYSITSLLVNISSIFNEVVLAVGSDKQRKRQKNRSSLYTIDRRTSAELLKGIRSTNCSVCGHSHGTPYPVLESNKLPFEMHEVNVNEAHYKDAMEKAIKKKRKAVQAQIIKQRGKEPRRGVLIAGNIIETVKNNMFWQIRSNQCVNQTLVDYVYWQFTIETFERDESTFYADYVFGFTNDKDRFFGVTVDGIKIYKDDDKKEDEGDEKENIVYDSAMCLIEAQTQMTYVVDFANRTLHIVRDYKYIASVALPTSFVESDRFYPTMYVKDIRLHLKLDHDPTLLKVIKRNNKFPFENADSFNTLNKCYEKNSYEQLENSGKYYTDQESWNELLIKSLSTDILLGIFGYLLYPDLVHCRSVNTYWHSVLTGHNVFDRMEMRCYYTHESIGFKKKAQCVLGVGLNVKRTGKWISTVSSEMDFLSLSAYKDYDIDTGAWGETITHYLPLIINEKHITRAKKCLLKRIPMMIDEITFNPKDALMIVTAIMNQFVVQLMADTVGFDDDNEDERKHYDDRNFDPKHASEKALVGYCAFHHMLLYLSQEYPDIKRQARRAVKKFIERRNCREKSETPDLGKFLLNLSIVEDYSWKDIAPYFVEESMDRQVKWYLQKYPKLAFTDDSLVSPHERIACTLRSTVISRRLVEFQVFFLENVCKQDGYSTADLLNNYNKRWGQPTDDLKSLLVRKVKNIVKKSENLNSWLDYFKMMGVHKYKDNAQVCNALKKAMQNSANKGYHRENRRQKKQNRRNNGGRPRRTRYVEPVPMIEPAFRAESVAPDTEIMEKVGEICGHNDLVTCLQVIPSSDGSYRLVSGSRDKTLIIWQVTVQVKEGRRYTRIARGKAIRRLTGHNHFISDVDVSNDGGYMLSSSWDGMLRLWNGKTGKVHRKFSGHKKDILAVRFSADNRCIVSCGRDKSINIWNVVGKLQHVLSDAHKGWVTAIEFIPADDGTTRFVTASTDKTLCVWQIKADYSSAELIHTLVKHEQEVTCIAVSPDGSLCASCDKLGTVWLWDLHEGKPLSTIVATQRTRINSCKFSPNRYWLCLAVGTNCQIYDLETKTVVCELKAFTMAQLRAGRQIKQDDVYHSIVWTSDGRTLFAARGKKIDTWYLDGPDFVDIAPAEPVPASVSESKRPESAIASLTPPMRNTISVQSALCIIPPKTVWDSIQNIRREHDPAYPRWMPHINIFFPFIDERYFDDIAQHIEHNIVKANNICSFTIDLNQFDVFERIRRYMAGSTSDKMETLFLRPSSGRLQMQNIFDKLRSDWPTCADKHGGAFNPHLTMGKFEQRSIADRMSSFQSSWRPISFQCEALYLISRRGSEPFEIRRTIPLC